MPTSSSALPRTAWLVVVLLMPVAMLNYLDRQMLAAMKTSMMAAVPDIDTDARWGVVLGSFKWVYACLSPVGGYLADRGSRRRTGCARPDAARRNHSRRRGLVPGGARSARR